MSYYDEVAKRCINAKFDNAYEKTVEKFKKIMLGLRKAPVVEDGNCKFSSYTDFMGVCQFCLSYGDVLKGMIRDCGDCPVYKYFGERCYEMDKYNHTKDLLNDLYSYHWMFKSGSITLEKFSGKVGECMKEIKEWQDIIEKIREKHVVRENVKERRHQLYLQTYPHKN